MTVALGQSSRHLSNTLVITNVPEELFEPALMASLQAHFMRFGDVRLWAPLRTFGRVLAVFTNATEASKAKVLDKSLIQDAQSAASNRLIPSTVIRVYYTNSTPDHLLDATRIETHLPVPVTDRNFLISPPGSPPIGWEQIQEDPPNTQTLADDLMAALHQLALEHPDFDDDDADDVDVAQVDMNEDANPDTLVIESPADASFPSVLVSDMDPHAPKPINGISIKNTPNGIQRRAPSPRPPISAVKATVESMAGPPPGGFNSAWRITPTARPPLS